MPCSHSEPCPFTEQPQASELRPTANFRHNTHGIFRDAKRQQLLSLSVPTLLNLAEKNSETENMVRLECREQMLL